MGKRCCECTPVHVTEWRRIYVDRGTLYAVFYSGNTEHAVAMGPTMALEAIEMAKRALVEGDVLPLRAAGPH